MMVIVLPVAMGMPVMMRMPVIVMMVTVRVGVVMAVAMIVSMVMRVAVAVAGIGAAHRVEGCDDILDLGAEPFEHRLDDMVAQDQDAVSRDGGGEMAVADVPGELGEMERIPGPDRVERLVGGGDLDHAAALDCQGVACRQNHRLGQVDQDLAAVAGFDHAPAQMALVMLEDGAAEHRLLEQGGVRPAPDGYRFQHGAPRFGQGRLIHLVASPMETSSQALTMKEDRALAQTPLPYQYPPGHCLGIEHNYRARV